MKRIDRLGEIKLMNCGEYAQIVEYKNAHDIRIRFSNGEIVKCSYQQFNNKEVKTKLASTICGQGYIGIGKHQVSNHREITIQYKYWNSMIIRCFDKKFKIKHPQYKDVTCCADWLNFQIFAEWFDKNYYEIENDRMQLDKDILLKRNKIYSPQTSVFVPNRINTLFTKSDATRGEYPIGVTLDKRSGKLLSQCSVYYNRKLSKKHLGHFDNPFDAFNAYKNFKEIYIKEVADEYKDRIPRKLYDAMYRYEVEITD